MEENFEGTLVQNDNAAAVYAIDQENLEWVRSRPVRSAEKRKRFFLEMSKFNMQEFFDDREDDAKMKANVQSNFVYGEDKRSGELPEETCHIRWTKLMNVILPEKANKKVIDMVHFMRNEYEILHRNMPFMFKKSDEDDEGQAIR